MTNIANYSLDNIIQTLGGITNIYDIILNRYNCKNNERFQRHYFFNLSRNRRILFIQLIVIINNNISELNNIDDNSISIYYTVSNFKNENILTMPDIDSIDNDIMLQKLIREKYSNIKKVFNKINCNSLLSLFKNIYRQNETYVNKITIEDTTIIDFQYLYIYNNLIINKEKVIIKFYYNRDIRYFSGLDLERYDTEIFFYNGNDYSHLIFQTQTKNFYFSSSCSSDNYTNNCSLSYINNHINHAYIINFKIEYYNIDNNINDGRIDISLINTERLEKNIL